MRKKKQNRKAQVITKKLKEIKTAKMSTEEA